MFQKRLACTQSRDKLLHCVFEMALLPFETSDEYYFSNLYPVSFGSSDNLF